VEPVDGDVGNEIPIHAVAERLVDADTVLIHGQTLRSSQHGRGRKAAVQDIGLKRVRQAVADAHAAQTVGERPGKAGRPVLGQLASEYALDVARNLVDVDIYARNRRRADDQNFL